MVGLLLAGTGGFIGSAARHLVRVGMQRFYPDERFPFATLFVNIAGCFLIGWLAGFIDVRGRMSENTRIFLMTGILGGFTTFSAFGYDAWALWREAAFGSAILYVVITIVVGLAAVRVGMTAAGMP
ncbi:MAG: fluoride efflux transporter CrcB [Candidatus Hydrogenedentota bacterium]